MAAPPQQPGVGLFGGIMPQPADGFCIPIPPAWAGPVSDQAKEILHFACRRAELEWAKGVNDEMHMSSTMLEEQSSPNDFPGTCFGSQILGWLCL
jgi:hypothetical protein